MMKSDFMRVDEVVTELDVSRPFAYRVIRQLNDELKKLGEKGEVKLITLEDMYGNMH